LSASSSPVPSLNDLDVTHKTVLLRLDLNIEATNIDLIAQDFRIQSSLPVLRNLMERQAKIVILAHRGRPKGIDPALSNEPLATGLQQALGATVTFIPHLLGAPVEAAVTALQPGQIIMLDNLRFDPREEKNDAEFAASLAALGDVYVNDAFASCHRAHASVAALAGLLPHAAGPLLEHEVKVLSAAMGNMARPTAAIIGGSKVSTKLALLGNLIHKMDFMFVGGAMANTFLAAEGIDVQKSLIEPDLVPAASTILATAHSSGCQILLPHDAIVSTSVDEPGIAMPCLALPKDGMILDIGPATLLRLSTVFAECRTVIWNGPVGLFEKPAFATGTLTIARWIAERTREGTMRSIAGGGDTVAALQMAGVSKDLTYISTAGGAFLEYMEGRQLPGLLALGITI